MNPNFFFIISKVFEDENNTIKKDWFFWIEINEKMLRRELRTFKEQKNIKWLLKINTQDKCLMQSVCCNYVDDGCKKDISFDAEGEIGYFQWAGLSEWQL